MYSSSNSSSENEKERDNDDRELISRSSKSSNKDNKETKNNNNNNEDGDDDNNNNKKRRRHRRGLTNKKARVRKYKLEDHFEYNEFKAGDGTNKFVDKELKTNQTVTLFCKSLHVTQLHRELSKRLKRKRSHLDNGCNGNGSNNVKRKEKSTELDQNSHFIREDISE